MASERSTVAVVGLGAIGGGAARCLVREGWTVIGCDVRPEVVEQLAGGAAPGAIVAAASPREAAEAAEVLLIAVMTDEQARGVLYGADGVFAAASLPSVIVILSTVTHAMVLEAGERAAERGVAVLDCGVSGGSQSLAEGSITAIVGGDAAAVAQAEPVLSAFADPIVHVGVLGDGMRAKIVRNLIFFCAWQVAWEGGRLAEAAGIDVDKLVEVVEASDKWVHGHMALLSRGLGIASDDPDLAFGRGVATYAHKDLALALEMGDELGVDLPTARYTEEAFDVIAGIERPS